MKWNEKSLIAPIASQIFCVFFFFLISTISPISFAIEYSKWIQNAHKFSHSFLPALKMMQQLRNDTNQAVESRYNGGNPMNDKLPAILSSADYENQEYCQNTKRKNGNQFWSRNNEEMRRRNKKTRKSLRQFYLLARLDEYVSDFKWMHTISSSEHFQSRFHEINDERIPNTKTKPRVMSDAR